MILNRQHTLQFLSAYDFLGDDVYQPFEPQLDWSQFSVAVLEKDIPTLHERLDALVREEGRTKAMERALACVAQHMVYSSITGGVLGDSGEREL